MSVDCFGLVVSRPTCPPSVWPHLFCGAGHEKRRGEQWKWFLAFTCTLEVFHVHRYQDQFIQPGWAECVFVCAYLAQVCALHVYLSFLICLYPHSFVFPWAVELSPLQFFGASVTNLNEPPRALATSTVMWIRS